MRKWILIILLVGSLSTGYPLTSMVEACDCGKIGNSDTMHLDDWLCCSKMCIAEVDNVYETADDVKQYLEFMEKMGGGILPDYEGNMDVSELVNKLKVYRNKLTNAIKRYRRCIKKVKLQPYVQMEKVYYDREWGKKYKLGADGEKIYLD